MRRLHALRARRPRSPRPPRRGTPSSPSTSTSPAEPQLESPRPYLLLRTRDGQDVTAYRPDDHVWHKGLSLALPVVGPHNFWGGPTYVRVRATCSSPNNGAQVHTSFAASDTPVAEAAGGIARLDERLDWVTSRATTSSARPARSRLAALGRRVGAHVAQCASQ